MMINLPAWLPPLADFNQGRSNAEAITNGDPILHHATGRDMFAKATGSFEQGMRIKPGFCDIGRPRDVMLGRIKMHGLIRAAMYRGIGDLITLNTRDLLSTRMPCSCSGQS